MPLTLAIHDDVLYWIEAAGGGGDIWMSDANGSSPTPLYSITTVSFAQIPYITVVPEPSSLTVAATSLAGLALYAWRRRRKHRGSTGFS